jgi:SAM-dependent methyltransferase
MREDPLKSVFPEFRVVNFMHRQDRFVFYSMLNELVKPTDVLLDFGAGRGRQAELGGPHLRAISCFRGRVARIIGVDIDDAVLRNPVLDEAHVIAPAGRLPLADASVDLVYSYAVFEHVEEPRAAASELARVVKPGGWICAWTPNQWGYVSIGSRLIPNALHARLLTVIAPNGRGAADVFPTYYRMNTLAKLRGLFPEPGFENLSFGFNAQPSYNFGSKLVARFWLLYMALTPRWAAQSLFVFIRKRG